jgi:hypothetical protein
MKSHWRNAGAFYILWLFFWASIAAYLISSTAEFTLEQIEHGSEFSWSEYWPTFFAATFENWQSEWIQLIVQGYLMHYYAEKLFFKEEELQHKILGNQQRLEAKLDRLLIKVDA